MKRLRLLVVEDSITVRKYLVEVLQSDPELEVIAEAGDGKQAIELCERLRPDLVTMDMMLPMMTGMAATEYIMAYCPTPILIVSASTNRGELFKTYQALAAGAVDVIEKPLGDASDHNWERQFLSTVKVVARVKVITHPRAKLRGPNRQPALRTADLSPASAAKTACHCLIAVGVSTGGPQALAAILGGLPANFPLPLLVVMHISAAFGRAFAEWLNDQCAIPVTMAVHGEPLPDPGQPRVLLAPPERHLKIQRGRLWLSNDPEVHSCRPSVDVLFESVASEIGERAVAVLLTGMGRDGARGLLAVRAAGGLTIAQDEATSVVFGMPREAILLSAAQRVLPLHDIAPCLRDLAVSAEGSQP